MDNQFIYTRNGTKLRVIYRDDEKVLAAAQIVTQCTNYRGDDFEEHEDDGPIRQLRPSECFDETPTIQVSEELVALETRAHEVRKEIHDLKRALKTAQEEHDEKIKALSKRDAALERLAEFLDGGIAHYFVLDYGWPKILTVDETMDDDNDRYRRNGNERMGRLLTLSPVENRSFYADCGGLEWRLNECSQGSSSNTDRVIPCSSRDEALALMQSWVDAEASVERPHQRLIDIARKYGAKVPDGYIKALIEQQRQALEKSEQTAKKEQREEREKHESAWR